MATNNSIDNRIVSSNFDVLDGNINIGNATPANPFDLAIDKSVAGLMGMSIQNTSSNASAGATLQLISEVGSADPVISYTTNGGNTWATGLDNGSSDAFKISQGSSLGTNDTFVMTTAGERTMPLQPSFLAFLPSDDLNQTGNGSAYILGTVTALTELFDQGGDFNTNGTFTAPVTGRYFFSFTILISGITAAMTDSFNRLDTSNRNYTFGRIDPGAVTGPNGYSWVQSAAADMDSGDTATVNTRIFNGAGNDADIRGSASPTTFFSGYLVC